MIQEQHKHDVSWGDKVLLCHVKGKYNKLVFVLVKQPQAKGRSAAALLTWQPQTDGSQTVYNVPWNVCCPEGDLLKDFKGENGTRWHWLISPPSVSMLDVLCVGLEQLPKSRLTRWHSSVPQSFKWAFLSVSSKNSVVVEEGSSMFSRDFAASCFDLKMTKFILIGGQVFPWSVCCFMASKTFEWLSSVLFIRHILLLDSEPVLSVDNRTNFGDVLLCWTGLVWGITSIEWHAESLKCLDTTPKISLHLA